MAYLTLFHSVITQSCIGFSSVCVPPPDFLPRGQSILCGGYSSAAAAVLCSSSNILTSLTMFLFPFGPTLENTLLLVLPSPARLVWVTPMMSLILRLHSAFWAALTADHFVPDFISGYAFRMTSSAESFINIWRRTFSILNSSTMKILGAVISRIGI